MAEAPDLPDFGMTDHFGTELLKKIEKNTENSENGCILYTGRMSKTGYGVIDVRFPGKTRHVPIHTHRARYMIEMKKVKLTPSEFHVSHLCHNRICVNILHLSFEPAHVNNSRQNCFSEKRCTKHCPYPECIFN